MASTPPRGAIAYLAQGVRHSTYGRDSLALLRRSLSLLYENYAAAAAEPNCSERALVGADEAAGGGPHAFRSQRLRQLLGPRSRDLTGDRERRLMGPQGRKHVYRMHHCEPLSAVL